MGVTTFDVNEPQKNYSVPLMASTSHIVMVEDHMDGLYRSRNPLVRFVHSGRLNAIVKLVPDGVRIILDAGCGEGHLLERLKEAGKGVELCGVDVTSVAVKRARERCPTANIVEGDIAHLPYDDNSISVIVCTEVIEHVPEYDDVLREFKRVLQPNGRLIITFPNERLWTVARALLLRRPIKVPDHVNSFSPYLMSMATHGLWAIGLRNLPFGLPFWLSLNCVMVFKKQ